MTLKKALWLRAVRIAALVNLGHRCRTTLVECPGLYSYFGPRHLTRLMNAIRHPRGRSCMLTRRSAERPRQRHEKWRIGGAPFDPNDMGPSRLGWIRISPLMTSCGKWVVRSLGPRLPPASSAGRLHLILNSGWHDVAIEPSLGLADNLGFRCRLGPSYQSSESAARSLLWARLKRLNCFLRPSE